MLVQFLNVLMQVLVHKSHDLLHEEVIVTVYNMATVDFNRFYSDFLPHFLSSCEGLDSNQRNILVTNFKVVKVSVQGLPSNGLFLRVTNFAKTLHITVIFYIRISLFAIPQVWSYYENWCKFYILYEFRCLQLKNTRIESEN
jgi:hypothetical protein